MYPTKAAIRERALAARLAREQAQLARSHLRESARAFAVSPPGLGLGMAAGFVAARRMGKSRPGSTRSSVFSLRRLLTLASLLRFF